MSHVLSILEQVDPKQADLDDYYMDDEDDVDVLATDSRVVGERWLQMLHKLVGLKKKVPVGALGDDKSPADMASAVLAAHHRDKTAAIRYMEFVLNRQKRSMDPAHRAKIQAAIRILQSS